MELNNYYYEMQPSDNKSLEDNSRSSPSLFSRIFWCLYGYTFGSCQYFSRTNLSLSRTDRVELRTLWESQGTGATDTNEDHWRRKARKADSLMRKRVRYHFKDHIKKWVDMDRRRFPWKMILYISLIVLVTVQVR